MGMHYDYLLPHPDPDRDRTGLPLYGYLIWCHFWQLVGANLLFLLCCIPIITIPAAYTALCGVTLQMLRKKPVHVWHDFFAAFRSCFTGSLAVGLVTLTAPLLSFYVIPFYRTYAQQNSVFLVPLALVVLATLFQILISLYAYPMLTAMDLSAGTVIRNSALLALVKLPQNILVLLLLAFLWLIIILALPVSLILLVFFHFSALSLAATCGIWKNIETYVVRKDV